MLSKEMEDAIVAKLIKFDLACRGEKFGKPFIFPDVEGEGKEEMEERETTNRRDVDLALDCLPTIEEVFMRQFVLDRLDQIGRELIKLDSVRELSDKAAGYEKAITEKVGFKTFDAYLCLQNEEKAICDRYYYLQGLRDGFKLYSLLCDKGGR